MCRVTILIHDRDDVAAVAANEFAPVVVEAEPVLAAAALGAQVERARVKGEIAPAQFKRRVRPAPCRDRAAIATRRAMDAMVQAPGETIEQLLNVEPLHPLAKPGEHPLALIRHAIAVCVLEINNVRRRAHEHAALPADDRRRPRQSLGEYRALVEAPVAVRVFEQPDAPQLFVATLRVVAHLDDEQPPIFIKRHRDGIDDERFGGGEFDAEAGFDLERGERLVRRRGRHTRKVVRSNDRFGRAQQRVP